jgi:hypothetical protein
VDANLSFPVASLSAVILLALLRSRSAASFALLLVVSRKMIFLFAAIYCTLVERDDSIVTLHRTLVYSLGGLDSWRMPHKSAKHI